VTSQAKDGTTALHRVAAASVRALEPREAQPEEEVVAIDPAAGAWLSLLAVLLKHCTEGGGDAAATLVQDQNGDSALHLLARCSGLTSPNPAVRFVVARRADLDPRDVICMFC
jgi:hypothetical protein